MNLQGVAIHREIFPVLDNELVIRLHCTCTERDLQGVKELQKQSNRIQKHHSHGKMQDKSRIT